MVVVTGAVRRQRRRGTSVGARAWRRLADHLRMVRAQAFRVLVGALSRSASEEALPLYPTAPAKTGALSTAPHATTFSDLFLRYRLPLIEYIAGMTRDRELATDLVQDTFVRAYAARQSPNLIANPRAWLYRIATNATLNALRHQRHFTWLPLGRVEPEAGADDATGQSAWRALPPLELPSEDVAITVAEREAVWSVLEALPPRWRAVLLLQTTSGFTVAEIAVLLHLSEPNVRMILCRAKERFRATYTRLNAKGGQE